MPSDRQRAERSAVTGQAARRKYPAYRILLCATLMLTGQACAEIYKYQDAQGGTVYTDDPPEGEQVEEVTQTINSSIPALEPDQVKKAKDQALREQQRRDQKLRQLSERMALRDKLKENLKAAEDRLKLVTKEREEAETPKPEDRQHSIITGTTRLKQSYFDKLAELDAKIEQAKKDVAQAKENLRKMELPDSDGGQ